WRADVVNDDLLFLVPRDQNAVDPDAAILPLDATWMRHFVQREREVRFQHGLAIFRTLTGEAQLLPAHELVFVLVEIYARQISVLAQAQKALVAPLEQRHVPVA